MTCATGFLHVPPGRTVAEVPAQRTAGHCATVASGRGAARGPGAGSAA
ncbi:hypothetical protein LO771_19780 [Streptacidiphilus sp. ASG 303]|nr:hypothetical protein [Streptacidiphilus sp. ASG 303]MCD0484574.1 hypothetical protein [Streptacidiphilus sp. ASG 303]